MKRLFLWQLICLFFAITTIYAQPCTTMYVKGRYLYTAAGEKVVLKGVNEMFIYAGSDKQGTVTLPEIAKTKANSVRIVWNTSGASTDLDALLNNCINNKMIPMVQLDDLTRTYGGDINQLSVCVNYWKLPAIVNVMQKYKKWVLLNIANEAGAYGTSASTFQTAYNSAVAQLRAVGYTMPLVIDAPDFGKDETTLLATWSNILNNDTQKNCLFSIHTYWKDSNPANLQTRFSNMISQVVSNNVPFIIGEGPQQNGYDCNTTFPYQYAMQVCQTNEIGWLAWTWGKVQDGTGGSCTNNFDITTNGVYGSWSNTWGQNVALSDVNSIFQTSIRPASMLGTADVVAPTVPTGLAKSNVTGNGLTLTWTASTDNFGVGSYDVYSGTTLLGNTSTNSINLTSLNCNTTYAFTVKAKDCAGNVSAASAAISVLTGACDIQAPTAPASLSASNTTSTATTLSWGASTDNVGVTGYYIYQNNGTTPINSTAITTTSYSVAGLTCNTTYTFSVKAKDAAGNNSVASNTVSVTTLACPPAPCDVVYNDNLLWNSTAASSWGLASTPSNSAGPTPLPQGSYSMKVDYSGAAYGGWVVNRSTVLSPAANCVLKFSVYGASSATNQMIIYAQSAANGGTVGSNLTFDAKPNVWTEYTFTMTQLGMTSFQRLNFKNNTANAITVYFDNIRFEPSSLIDITPPSIPSFGASVASSSSVNLNWSAATDNVGVTGYQVFVNGSLIGTTTTLSYSVTGLICGTNYSFFVRPIDAAGNFSQTPTATLTTLACPAPTVVVYDESLNTGWEETNSSGGHWSWGYQGMDFNNSWAKVGSKSIYMSFYANGGLVLRKINTAHNTTSSTTVRFWAYTNNATSLQVYTNSTDSGNPPASPFIVSMTPNVWTEYTVPMSQLGNPSQIKRIIFQNYSNNNAIIYFDNIRLESVSGARISSQEITTNYLEENNTNSRPTLTLYPNPTNTRVNVNFELSKSQHINIDLIEVSGKLIKTIPQFANEGSNSFEIDLGQAKMGSYLVRIITEQGVISQKLLIER